MFQFDYLEFFILTNFLATAFLYGNTGNDTNHNNPNAHCSAQHSISAHKQNFTKPNLLPQYG
jgi:hypothetical protein